MNRSTLNGVIVFAAVICTLLLWVPLSSDPRREEDGTIHSATRFGLFGYLFVHAELREPDYELSTEWQRGRLAVTIAATALLWTAAGWRLRSGKGNSTGDRPERQ